MGMDPSSAPRYIPPPGKKTECRVCDKRARFPDKVETGLDDGVEDIIFRVGPGCGSAPPPFQWGREGLEEVRRGGEFPTRLETQENANKCRGGQIHHCLSVQVESGMPDAHCPVLPVLAKTHIYMTKLITSSISAICSLPTFSLLLSQGLAADTCQWWWWYGGSRQWMPIHRQQGPWLWTARCGGDFFQADRKYKGHKGCWEWSGTPVLLGCHYVVKRFQAAGSGLFLWVAHAWQAGRHGEWW